jgi:hypothetical protein
MTCSLSFSCLHTISPSAHCTHNTCTIHRHMLMHSAPSVVLFAHGVLRPCCALFSPVPSTFDLQQGQSTTRLFQYHHFVIPYALRHSLWRGEREGGKNIPQLLCSALRNSGILLCVLSFGQPILVLFLPFHQTSFYLSPSA